ncbi:hypothetical protein ASE16_02430 [Leifsonia sp. Root227]|uniref:four-carbon acid sugar kinase family protein n=1 Tax=Leifsonia sp. Root227 TaxID=1736496 RepID=UPI0006F6DE9A|nr:four-carbon acid sugar kinase family protein [Leifsonia sp. Root227]KRC51945.1 hypothetical protein ASE16_02430 [Leifsonia sp. Root227]
MNNLSVGIVADDLTSAADGAAPFRNAGLPVRIELDVAETTDRPGVVSIDTDSRRMVAAAAAVRTAVAVRSVRSAPILYKTVDSTLRGNLNSEVTAALSASGRRTAVIAPAFPSEGRTTVGAVQLLWGVPVDKTSFANDVSHPARESDLRVIFPTAVVWEPGAQPIPDGIVLVNASTDADLDTLVSQVGLMDDVLWVGSPGIAAGLARAVTAPSTPHSVSLAASRVLTVVGSQNPTSRSQLDRLLEPAQIVDARVGTDHAIDAIQRQLAADGIAGLVDRSPDITPEEASRRLASIVNGVHAGEGFDALIATGGATARAILDSLRTRTLELVDEPEPGIVALVTSDGSPFPLIVKAGGFGDNNALARLATLLRPTSHPQELS